MRAHHDLAALAGTQHGVVARKQLQALGYSDGAIDRAADLGRLHHIHRGVYAVGHMRLSSHGYCQAALLACGRQALLSHTSAAWLWGLHPRLALPVEVIRPSRGHRRSAIRVHHAPGLGVDDRAEREGLRLTGLARTFLDLAARESRIGLKGALDRADRLGIFDLHAIDSLLGRAGKHPGTRKLRHATDPFREPGFTRSGLERYFLALVRKMGLPVPSANLFVAGFELDMYWERERFAVELDTYKFHRGRTAFEKDRVRQEELKLAGIEMVRITDVRLEREPEVVMKRLATLLAQRR